MNLMFPNVLLRDVVPREAAEEDVQGVGGGLEAVVQKHPTVALGKHGCRRYVFINHAQTTREP